MPLDETRIGVVAAAGRGAHEQRDGFALVEVRHAVLRAGGRKVAGWLQQQHYTQAHFSDQTAFMNLNTQDDLKAFISQRRPGNKAD